MTDTITGQCLCGAIAFEFDEAAIALFNNCYCKNCQRSSGCGCVSQLQIDRKRFMWIRGADAVSRYESSPGVLRTFCSTCGSRVPMTDHSWPHIPVPAGLLDQPVSATPEVNMHLASRAEWATVDESITCLEDQGSMEFWQSFMARRKPNDHA